MGMGMIMVVFTAMIRTVVVRMFVMVAVAWMAVVGERSIGMAHPTIRQMAVIVVMLVDGERGSRPVAEQALVLGAAGNRNRGSLAADMPVQAYHLVGCGHDDVKVM